MSNTQTTETVKPDKSQRFLFFIRRPFSLAIRLTFLISMVTIAAFFAFTAFISSSIEDHLAKQDVNDLKRMSAKVQEILNTQQSDRKTIREIRNVTSSYLDAAVIVMDSNGLLLYSSDNSNDLIDYIEQDNISINDFPKGVFVISMEVDNTPSSEIDKTISLPDSTDTAEVAAIEVSMGEATDPACNDADAPTAAAYTAATATAATDATAAADAAATASASDAAASKTAATASAVTATSSDAAATTSVAKETTTAIAAATTDVTSKEASAVRDAKGHRVETSTGVSCGNVASTSHKVNHSFRAIALQGRTSFKGNDGGYVLLSALSINFHTRYIEMLKQDLLFIATCMSLLIVAVVMIAVRKGHDPLREVSEDIKNITSDNLDTRLDPNQVPAELTQLVMSFNGMIEKIEDVFNRQANFSADLAHEIRTPITNLLTQTEIALSQNRTCTELREVLYSSLEEYGRMSKMVSDMLFLAQVTDAKQMPQPILFDVCIEVTKVFEFFEALAEDRQVSLQMHHNSCAATNRICLMTSGSSVPGGEDSVGGYTHVPLIPVIIEGDQLMFRRAMSNLVSNAMRYTPTHGVIRVDIDESDEMCTVTVANPGKPIPPEHLPRLFDRFYRIDPSRQRKSESSGSGIGLAIVKSIVEAHNGRVSVESDEISTRFILHLPRRLHNKVA